jgi:hypothetical protein
MTLGGLILIALIVSVIVICYKVREHSKKLRELEGVAKKPAVNE